MKPISNAEVLMPVNDAEVRWVIMKYLSGLIDEGHIEPLIAGGLTPELLDMLRNRRMRDITRIASDASIGFHIKVDNLRLTRAFLRLDAVVRDRELLEYFVRHGASSSFMYRIFQISTHELRTMRKVFGAETERGGRPNLPDPALREVIHAAWIKIQSSVVDGSEDMPERREREQIYALSQLFPDYKIATLWGVINELGDPSFPVKAKSLSS